MVFTAEKIILGDFESLKRARARCLRITKKKKPQKSEETQWSKLSFSVCPFWYLVTFTGVLDSSENE